MRRRTLDTVGVYDTTRWGPVLLMRVMMPSGDPYKLGLNPHVCLRPYVDGSHRYIASLRLGRWSFEVRWESPPGQMSGMDKCPPAPTPVDPSEPGAPGNDDDRYELDF
jgi:hypothetical protein